LVVGAPSEDSNQSTITNGINASSNNSLTSVGAVYVYQRTENTWAQQAYVKATNPSDNAYFGSSVSISGDTLVVGVANEDGNQSTITNGTTSSTDHSLNNSGAVYVYQRTGNIWAQQAYIKAFNAASSSSFGDSVSINGNLLAVGAHSEDNNQSTITNGTTPSTNEDAANSGAVYVYQRTGSTWALLSYIKAANSEAGDKFGNIVLVSGDTVIAAAGWEDSNQNTITNGDTASDNNDISSSGAVYIYQK
jgi:riboflavin synthase alpha subunit